MVEGKEGKKEVAKVTLISHTPYPEYQIIRAALSTRGIREMPPMLNKEKYLKNLLQKGHLSVFEFAYATFSIEGVSLVFLAQITRHRLASFAVKSHRYAKAYGFIIPPEIQKNVELREKFASLLDGCYSLYEEMVQKGIKKEDARFILPCALSTSMIMSANFREWLHILKLRTAPEAQWEIREVCKEIGRQLYKIAPIVFEEYKE